ncbi:MAG: PAS domain S-box protein, partial [Armatimonadota bacterium]
DVILLYNIATEINEFEICRMLKADACLQDIPVLFITDSNTDHESRVKAIDAGAESFLSNPPDDLDLIAQIRTMVKIKTANQVRRMKKEQLEELVSQRTEELELELAERKKIEKALRASEQSLSDAQHLAHIGNWQWIINTDTIIWSEELYYINNIDPNQKPPSYDEMSSFYTPDSWNRLGEAIREALRSGSSYELDLEIVRSDDIHRHQHVQGEVDYDINGNIVKLHGTVQDITDRKLTESKLIASETRYRRLFESAKDGILILDVETGMIVDVNPFMLEMLGYSREELIEKEIWEIGAFKDTVANWDKFIELQQKDYVRYDDLPLETVNGREIDIEFVSNVYMVDGKKVIQCNIRDITERKKFESALQQSEALFKKLFEDDSAVKLLIDPVTSKIIDANKAAAKYYGWPQDRLKQMMMEEIDVLPPEELRQEFEKLRTEGKVCFELRHKRADGSIRDVEIFVSDIETQGGRFNHAIIHDITDRKQAESALRIALDRLQKVTGSVIDVIVMAVESRDPYTSGHQKRVSDLAQAIAVEMGLPPEQVEGIRLAGLVHDLGKISIPAEILSTPRKLSELEYNLIKTHSQHGYNILKDVDFDWPVAQIVYQHHERMDGSGYPRGLKGDDIIMEARIIAIADVVEAMASHRPYRPCLGIDLALDEITSKKGILYDSTVVDICYKLFHKQGYELCDV